MTDRLLSEDRIAHALRTHADEAVRPFDPTEIARLSAGTGSNPSRQWVSLFGRQNRSVRWAIVATALLLLATIAALVGAALLRDPQPLGGGPLFLSQMICDTSCLTPTGVRASTIDPQTGQTTASWDLAFSSDSMSGPSIQPAWSPDRRHVLLYDWNNQLVAIVDVATGTLAKPIGDDPTGITGYTWGPGSDRIARVAGGDADGVDIVDLDLHRLARFEVPRDAMIATPPAWSPDGFNIVVTGCFPCDTSWLGSPPTPNQQRLFVMPVDGSPVRALPIRSESQIGMPAWSPDGKAVAFGTVAGIWTITVADGLQRAATSEPGGDPRWSPDGRRVAFSSAVDGQLGGIVLVDVDGGRRTTLTNGPDSHPQWSPDGTWIAFTRGGSDPDPGSQGDAMIVPAIGGEPRLISTGALAGW